MENEYYNLNDLKSQWTQGMWIGGIITLITMFIWYIL